MTKLPTTRDRATPVELNEHGIYVFESRHSPNFSMDMGQWHYHKLCVIEAGHGWLRTESNRVAIHANQVIWVPPDLPHCFEDQPADALTLLMVCYLPSVINEHAQFGHLMQSWHHAFPMAQPFTWSDNYRRAQFTKLMQSMIVEQSTDRRHVGALLLARLIELHTVLLCAYEDFQNAPGQHADHRAFAASLEFLKNEFYNSIHVEELASIANMSYRRYTDRFRRETGTTVVQYINRLRVEYAKQRLLESSNIVHSAMQAGFGDLAHFYRVFKRMTGMTPKQFLDKHTDPSQRQSRPNLTEEGNIA